MNYKKTVIMSLGGSLLFPEGIDTSFIASWQKLVKVHVAKGTRFIVIIGGGKVCRRYQEAMQNLNADATSEDSDWVGIYTTRLNAQFMRYAYGDSSAPDILIDPHAFNDTGEPVIFGAGWKPGWSTDYAAVEVAEVFKAETVINLSNIDRVYTKDPKKYEDAEPVESISWSEYRSIIPDTWEPGLNTPFDPIASKKAEAMNLEVVIMGADLGNLDAYLRGEAFTGTRIARNR